jgi:hypothetical protein
MNFLKKILAESGKLFEEGKPLSFAYPLWEAADTIFFSTNSQTSLVLILEIIWILKEQCFLLLLL